MNVARGYLLAGVAALGLYFALPWGSFGQTLVYDAIGVSAAAAAVAGARLHRPSLRLPWYLFAAGPLAFAPRGGRFNLYPLVSTRAPPRPAAPAAFRPRGRP